MSDVPAKEILDTLMHNLKDLVSTKSIIGEPIQAGNTTILPVMKVSLGFGAGGGNPPWQSEEKGAVGGAGGGGVSITPVGFLIVEDGKAMMITPGHSKWDWIAESIPDLWEKLSKMRGKSKKDSATESSKESKDEK